MSTSAAQIAANQTNAQKSTGPVTEQGKANSSKNNFRHGFRGKFAFVKSEDPQEFAQLVRELFEEHEPQTVTEQILVQSMAEHYWLVRRARHFQNIAQTQLDSNGFVREMSLWMRYEAQHERAFHKCLTELRKLKVGQVRDLRRTPGPADQKENGFERQKQEAAPAQRTEESKINSAKPVASPKTAGLSLVSVHSPVQAPPEPSRTRRESSELL